MLGREATARREAGIAGRQGSSRGSTPGKQLDLKIAAGLDPDHRSRDGPDGSLGLQPDPMGAGSLAQSLSKRRP